MGSLGLGLLILRLLLLRPSVPLLMLIVLIVAIILIIVIVVISAIPARLLRLTSTIVSITQLLPFKYEDVPVRGKQGISRTSESQQHSKVYG